MILTGDIGGWTILAGTVGSRLIRLDPALAGLIGLRLILGLMPLTCTSTRLIPRGCMILARSSRILRSVSLAGGRRRLALDLALRGLWG